MQSLSLPIFNRNSDCDRCTLHKYAESVCIPTHVFARSKQTHVDQAVLFLGEAPGNNEDQQDRNFCGRSGELLTDLYVEGSKLNRYADIFVGNSVRCHPVANATPGKSKQNACRKYLVDDLATLSVKYRRVVVICVGAVPLSTLVRRTIGEQFKAQGTRLKGWSVGKSKSRQSLPSFPNVYVFGTYHPAYLLRNPAKRRAVKTHLAGAYEFLKFGKINYKVMPKVENNPTYKDSLAGPLAFDTETWGILKWMNDQTVFHPQKGVVIDDVLLSEQISIATTAWQDKAEPNRKKLRIGLHEWGKPHHRANFLDALRRASEIRGQNLPYDIKEVRAAGGRLFRAVLRPFKKLLVDAMVRSFVYDDEAPERSIKATAPWLRIISYADEEKPVKLYHSPRQRKYRKYAGKDAWSSYLACMIFMDWTIAKFGKHPIARGKASRRCVQWFSDNLWMQICMEEWGIALDRPALWKIHKEQSKAAAKLVMEAKSEYGLTLNGPGSKASKASLLNGAVLSLLRVTRKRHGKGSSEYELVKAAVESLEKTKKTRELSCSASNRNMLVGLLPLDDSTCRTFSKALSVYTEVESLQKIVNSYTGPLLIGRVIKKATKYEYEIKPLKAKPNQFRITKKKGSAQLVYDRSPCAIPHYSTLERVGHSPLSTVLSALNASTPARDGVQMMGGPRLLQHCSPSGYRDGIALAFPQIFIVPKGFDERGKGGGVKQYRYAFKDPAAQTFPRIVKGTMTTRYSPGVLAQSDAKQIEWRTQMVIAGDPVGLREIRKGIDIHTRSAEFLLGDMMTDTDNWVRSAYGRGVLTTCPDTVMRTEARTFYERERKSNKELLAEFVASVKAWGRQNGGKSQNFAWMYGAGGNVINATVRTKCGMEIGTPKCFEFIDWLNGLYEVLHTYRQELIDRVCRDKALHLPLYGWTRSFGGTDEEIRELYTPIIYDMPIQCIATAFVLAVQIETAKEILKRKLKAVIPLNVHDAMFTDCHMSDWPELKTIIDDKFRMTEYRANMEKYYGRKFIVEYELKEIAVVA